MLIVSHVLVFGCKASSNADGWRRYRRNKGRYPVFVVTARCFSPPSPSALLAPFEPLLHGAFFAPGRRLETCGAPATKDVRCAPMVRLGGREVSDVSAFETA
jgi:hypothetical protein